MNRFSTAICVNGGGSGYAILVFIGHSIHSSYRLLKAEIEQLQERVRSLEKQKKD